MAEHPLVRVEVTHDLYTPGLLRSKPERIFVFGDNLLRKGTAGQAVIRFEPNAFGVPTKRAPSMERSAFFSDRDDEINAIAIALTNTVVFPAAGLGTGLARMAECSPEAYSFMCSILKEHFGFDQAEPEN